MRVKRFEGKQLNLNVKFQLYSQTTMTLFSPIANENQSNDTFLQKKQMLLKYTCQQFSNNKHEFI